MASKRARGIRSNVKTSALQKNLSGINQSRDERFLNPSEAQDIVNMHSLKEGTWSADRAGYSHVNTDALESGASIDGIHWYTDYTGQDFLLAAANGNLIKVDPATGVNEVVDPFAGYAVGSQVDFQNFGDYCFSCDGTIDTPRVFDGTFANASNGFPISDGINYFEYPKYVELHQNRIVYLNFAGYENHLAISNINDGESFDVPASTAAEGFITQVAPGDGGFITGARSLPIPNSNDDVLVIFKNRGIHALIGRSALDGDADVYKVIRINSDFGAFNNRCIVQVGQDLLAINEYGIVSYSSANSSGTIQPVGINVNRVREVVDRVNLNAIDKCWGIHLKDRREVWFGLATGSSTQVNEFIIYKYPDPGEPESVPKWSRRTGLTASHGTLYQKNFYIGTYNGFIGNMFNSSRYNTASINWRYEYPYWDMGNELQYKRVLWAEAHFRVRGAQRFIARTTWKGGGNNDVFSDSYPLATTVDGAVYGSAIYGSSSYGSRDELTHEFFCPGNGKRVKFELSGSTDLTGPEFLGLGIKFEVGGFASHWN